MNTCTLPWSHSWRVAGALIIVDLKEGLRKHLGSKDWRGRFLQAGGATFGLLFLAGLHAAAYAVLVFVRNAASTDSNRLLEGVSTAVWSFLIFVMISGGLVRALVVLHEQDDSRLLLASPVVPRAILGARLFGNAVQSCLVDGFIIIPWINMAAWVMASPGFLWGYIVWFAIALLVTCLDGLFSFGLIRWLGLRRARLFAQAVPFALIFGVTFCAGSLSISIAQMDLFEHHTTLPPMLEKRFDEAAATPAAWVARAAAGGLPFLAGLLATTAVMTVATLRLTERAFVEGSRDVSENAGQAAASAADGPFRVSFVYLEILKSLRLILRTPMFLVQCVAQVLTPVGIAVLLGRHDPAQAATFFVIFVAGVLSGVLTIAAGTVEECDDLLHMAPRRHRTFRSAKILSGCVGPFALAMVVALGLLLFGQWLDVAAVLLAGLPLGVASAIVGESFSTPVSAGTRPKLMANPIIMIPLLGMQITSGIVAGGMIFAAMLSPLALVGALGVTYLLLVMAVGLVQIRKPIFLG